MAFTQHQPHGYSMQQWISQGPPGALCKLWGPFCWSRQHRNALNTFPRCPRLFFMPGPDTQAQVLKLGCSGVVMWLPRADIHLNCFIPGGAQMGFCFLGVLTLTLRQQHHSSTLIPQSSPSTLVSQQPFLIHPLIPSLQLPGLSKWCKYDHGPKNQIPICPVLPPPCLTPSPHLGMNEMLVVAAIYHSYYLLWGFNECGRLGCLQQPNNKIHISLIPCQKVLTNNKSEASWMHKSPFTSPHPLCNN